MCAIVKAIVILIYDPKKNLAQYDILSVIVNPKYCTFMYVYVRTGYKSLKYVC